MCKANINGQKVEFSETEINGQLDGEILRITARYKTGIRFNVLTLICQKNEIGVYEINPESKNAVTFCDTEGQYYTSQNHTGSIGKISIIENKQGRVKLQFQVIIQNQGSKLLISGGDADVAF